MDGVPRAFAISILTQKWELESAIKIDDLYSSNNKMGRYNSVWSSGQIRGLETEGLQVRG